MYEFGRVCPGFTIRVREAFSLFGKRWINGDKVVG